MSNPKPRTLTEEQILAFQLNGFLVVPDVLSPGEIVELSERCDLIASGKAEHIPERYIRLETEFQNGRNLVENQMLSVRKLFNIAVLDPVMWQHSVRETIVDIVADLLATDDIKMYGDQLFMKAAEVGSEQPWHQDSASWRDIFPMDLVTAWTAIDNSSVQNGCLNFAPGTHRWGMLNRDQVGWFVDDLGSDQWPIVPVPLAPGSISFHHSLVLHQSNANKSGKRRRGYAVHYMRATSRRDENVTTAPKMPDFRQVRGRSFAERV